jgi:DNA-binding beta-propeller fold protein YncE
MFKPFLYSIVIVLFIGSLFVCSSQLSAGVGILDQPKADASPVNLEMIGNITIGKWVYCVAVNEWTNRVYVGTNESLVVIDGETNNVVAEIPMEYVESIAVNPYTNRIYAGGARSNITVFDGATNLKVGEIPIQVLDISEWALNPVTNLVYAPRRAIYVGEYDEVIVYDGGNFAPIAHIPLSGRRYSGFERIGVAVNPNTNTIYATWSGNSSLYSIDGDTNEVTANTAYPTVFENFVMVNPLSNYVYVGNKVLDGTDLEEVTVSYQGVIRSIDTIHNLLFTVNFINGDGYYCLDGISYATRGSLDFGDSPSSGSYQIMAVNPYTAKLYLIDSLGGKVYVISTGTSPLTPPTPTPSHSQLPSAAPTSTLTEVVSPIHSESSTSISTPNSESTFPSNSLILAVTAVAIIVVVAAVAAVILRRRRSKT